MFAKPAMLQTGSGALLEALDRSLAIIAFNPSGKILSANANFCAAMGFGEAEIVGQHHSMFVEPAYGASEEYREFWRKLGRGEFIAAEFKRLGKGGRNVWIQASYNPVLGRRGRVKKVVKIATEITAEKLKSAEYEGKIAAISHVQGIIEFTPSGEIITANRLFLDVMGYSLDEIQGRHHRMFVSSDEAKSEQYGEFWRRLNRGECISGDFKRFGNGGKQLWLQAFYNPILDLNGRVMKVVKLATDPTGRAAAVKSLGAGLSELAANNLSHNIEHKLDPAYEQLRADYNTAVEHLGGLVSGIVSNIGAIRSGTTEIAAAADDLSRRTEQQAASLEETAAALEQITTTVRRTADGAKQAGEAVGQARADADAVGRRRARSGFGDERDRAFGAADQPDHRRDRRDRVPDQPAGAERRGRSGARRGRWPRLRGGGVRGARSGAALRRRRQRDQGADLDLHAAGRTRGGPGRRNRPCAGPHRRAGRRDQHRRRPKSRHAAQEQATGLAEVNTAVNQMDQVTQQNAAMVEQTTAASHALAQETEQLAAMTAGSASPRAPWPRRPCLRAPSTKPCRPEPEPRPGLKVVGSRSGTTTADSWEEF